MNQSIRKTAQSGFTLVEVIVVAIIVAALAAVAVPMYTNYVQSSRTNAAANAAGSVASYMGACINQGGTVEVSEGGSVPTLGKAATLTCDPGGASIRLPIGIEITISSMTGTGSVTAKHVDSDTSGVQTYNY